MPMKYSIPAATTHAHLDVATTNKVLRNTYMLLAITLLPTVVGAFLGALFPLIGVMGMLSLAVFIPGLFGFQYMVMKNRNSSAGVAWLLAFTLFMGYFIGQLIGVALGSFSNGAELVALAAGGTAAIFFGLAGYATVTKRDFSSMSLGKILSIGMFMAFIISLVNVLFLQSSAIALAVSSLFIVIASVGIVFAINRVVRGGEDNYILATMTIYIMLWQLFQSLLHLLMFFAGDRD